MTTTRTDPPFVADEPTMLVAFLDHFRETLRRQVAGLDSVQLQVTLGPSTLTLGGLLKHVAFVEHYWFDHVLTGADMGEPWASVDWRADPDWDLASAVDDSAEDLLALHAREVAAADGHLRAVLDTEGPDALALGTRHGEPVTLRWVLVHMIEEYARHCGHADLIRESIDGRVDL